MDFIIEDARTFMQVAMYIRLFGSVIKDQVVAGKVNKSYVLGDYYLHTWSDAPDHGGYSLTIHEIKNEWKTFNYYPTATEKWCDICSVDPVTRFEVE